METHHVSSAIFPDKADLAKTLIQECTHGQVFSGLYVKSNGEERVFNGRAYADGSTLNTGKQLSPKLVPYIDNAVLISNYKALSTSLGRKLSQDQDKDLIEDARRKSWRSFNADRLKELNVAGIKYIF